MKRTLFLLTAFMFCAFSALMAQDNDAMIGTWDVMIEDTPQGNVNVILTIERMDGKLKAKFNPAGSDQETPITNISEQENTIIMYFFAEGYDLYMSLKPSEDDKVSGFLVDQFPVKGKRVKG
ncbi:MAG: hypothetical protein EA341_08355 [Mongoliibacter sp.]|uniref:hypothetical protein n=1 Tax=Mongoliibacter sp. TaxID=2022438 RepID=UPI0012F28948|nr:hypothetical protein [Mongoliibacter sp.]TVP49969.1 MAG: hypothetical protein EA341_08355 [Mongoliibacter sp.]